jgi:hypothetical protein
MTAALVLCWILSRLDIFTILHLKRPNNQQQQKAKEKGKLHAAINTGAITVKRKATQQNGAIGNQQSQKAIKAQKAKEKAK